MPHLARITIYPVKSLDGAEVAEAIVLPGGALEHDRRFAFFDAGGKVVNGKRTARVHRLRSSFDPGLRRLSLGIEGRDGLKTFHVDADRDALHDWLVTYFGFPVNLSEDDRAGYPDDTESPGPTVVSTATLEDVARWFPDLTVDDLRRRFRANLEIGGVEPHWEDRLYTEPDGVVRFAVGGVIFEGINPCRRCVVPSRSPTTGEPLPNFQKTFAEERREGLPPWAAASRFDHFYRLAVNTRPSDSGTGTIRAGDPVTVLGTAPRHLSGRVGEPARGDRE